MLMELSSGHQATANLFTDIAQQQKRTSLMQTLDAVNLRFGKNSLGTGIVGITTRRDWSMKQGGKSPNYTTKWDELAVVSALG
jgi:DNA polymerase V